MIFNESFETLHDNSGQCHRPVVIQAGDNRHLRDRYNGFLGSMGFNGNHRQSKREIEDVCKHLC